MYVYLCMSASGKQGMNKLEILIFLGLLLKVSILCCDPFETCYFICVIIKSTSALLGC